MKIIGQDDIINYFTISKENNTIHHCYLLHGKVGTGKKTLVKEIIKYLLCGNWECKCRACINIENGNHPDVSFFYTDDPIVKLETVNEFKKTALFSPIEGNEKIIVLGGVDRLNSQGANKLLTLIEEPPPYLKIFLLSDNIAKVMPTIKSRAIPLNLRPLKRIEISSYLLENHDVNAQDANMLANFSHGSLGQAINHLNSSFIENRKILYDLLIDTWENGTDYLKINNKLQDMDINTILDLLEFWLRDLFYLKLGKNKHILINSDYYDKIIQININNPELLIMKIKQIRNGLKHSINSMLNVEVIFNALQEVQ